MESIIRDYVMKYFLNRLNDLFSIRQYGILKGRSTVLQLLKIIDYIENTNKRYELVKVDSASEGKI